MRINQGDAQFAMAGWKLAVNLKGAGEQRELCVTARSGVTGTETLMRIPITIGWTPPPPPEPPAAPARATPGSPENAGPDVPEPGETGTGTGGITTPAPGNGGGTTTPPPGGDEGGPDEP
jgi:hypothetical protein